MHACTRRDHRLPVKWICAAAVLLGAAGISGTLGEDWPQWRGPNRDGISSETKWNPRWGAEGPTTLWQKQVGLGYATVAVRDGRLYTMGWDERSGSDVIYCMDPTTGEEHWRTTYRIDKYAKMHVGGPACTPSIDGDRLYIINREAHLYCLSTADGKILWEKNLEQTHGAKQPQWAFAGSPLVLGDAVIVDVGPTIAFDKKTGKEMWVSQNYGSAYSSPIAFEHEGKTRLAVFPEHGLVVLDASNGKELAKTRWETRYGVNAATPVVIGDRIFISSGYNTGCAMFQFTGSELKELWGNRHMRSQMATAVYRDGYLYGIDTQSRGGALQCIDAKTGELIWSHGEAGNGTVALAGDVLILLTESGEVVTAKVSPKGFEPLSAKAPVLRAQRCWVAPVLSNGLLYCRSPEGRLVCLDLRSDRELARLN